MTVERKWRVISLLNPKTTNQLVHREKGGTALGCVSGETFCFFERGELDDRIRERKLSTLVGPIKTNKRTGCDGIEHAFELVVRVLREGDEPLTTILGTHVIQYFVEQFWGDPCAGRGPRTSERSTVGGVRRGNSFRGLPCFLGRRGYRRDNLTECGLP